MELTKKQSLEIIYNNSKQEALELKYKHTTKYKWWCLSCLKTLYISYKQYSIISIFCPACFKKYKLRPTIAQYQYVMALKKRQLNLIESQVYSD